MASQKKVVVRQFDGFLLWGYLPAIGVLQDEAVQVLDTAGRVQAIRLANVKSIAYVKDFNLDDSAEPERLGRRAFSGRPKAEGLWLKLEFTDKDTIEGVSQIDRGFIDTILKDRCVGITPPEPKSNTYRLLVPRSALASVEILGSITQQNKRKMPVVKKTLQADLFGQS